MLSSIKTLVVLSMMLAVGAPNSASARTFQEWCEDQTITAEARRTVDAVLAATGAPSCDRLVASSVQTLSLISKGISDLSPLEGLPQLMLLEIGRNNIRDIRPLARLPRLVSLAMIGNPVENLTPLRDLTGLTKLQFSYVGGTDLSILGGLTRLQEIWIFDSGQLSVPAADLAVLGGLLELRSIWITIETMGSLNPAIQAIGSLAGLETLIIEGNTEATDTLDLRPLSGLSQLQRLLLDGAPVIDVSPLASLSGLLHLTVANGRQLSDLAPLAGLTALTELKLGGNAIQDISPLRGLTNLTSLDLQRYNLVSDYSALAGMTRLTALRARLTPENIESFFAASAGLENLQELDMQNKTAVLDESYLSRLPAMPQLYRIKIESSPNNLFAQGGNSLRDLSWLERYPSIGSLDLLGNSISDLSVLPSLRNLRFLNLSYNLIEDARPLADLATTNAYVSLSENPVQPELCPVDRGPASLQSFCRSL